MLCIVSGIGARIATSDLLLLVPSVLRDGGVISLRHGGYVGHKGGLVLGRLHDGAAYVGGGGVEGEVR